MSATNPVSTSEDAATPRSVTVEAESVEAGRVLAAERLGVPPEELRVTVLERERRGWFGRGPETLTLRATWSPPVPDEDATLDLWVEHGRVLAAVGRPQGAGKRVDEARVRAALDAWHVDVVEDAAIARAVRQMAGAPVEVAGIQPSVSAKDDAPLAIKVTTDAQEAWLIPWAALPGDPVEPTVLRDLLQEARVVFGIDTAALTKVARGAPRVPVRIAVGQRPKPGVDARLEYCFEGAPKTHAPTVRPDGTADFRELGFSPAVEAGTVLVVKTPATDGEPGRTVRGVIREVRPGRDVDVASLAGPGTAVSEDGLSLVATADGIPTQSDRRIAVMPSYAVDGDVDFSTGHVTFAGNLTIRGSVRPGFRVRATGTIQVHGLVDGGFLDAGGDLQVSGGIIGHASSVVRASGSIRTSFIESAEVHAGGSIEVGNEIRQSQVIAEGAIEVRGAGRIVASTVRARERVTARRLACPMGAQTVVQVGWGEDMAGSPLDESAEPLLIVREEADPDVQITIGNASRRLVRASPHGVFRNQDGRVVYAAQ